MTRTRTPRALRWLLLAACLCLVPAGLLAGEGFDLLAVIQEQTPPSRLFPLLRRWAARKRDKGADVRDLIALVRALPTKGFPSNVRRARWSPGVEVEVTGEYARMVQFDSSRFGLHFGVTLQEGTLSLYVPHIYSRAVEGFEKGAAPPPNAKVRRADFALVQILYGLFQGLEDVIEGGGVERLEVIGGDVLNANLVELFQSLGMRLKQPDNAWVLEVELPPLPSS